MSARKPIRTGRPDVKPDAPSHVKGVKEGNSTGNYDKQDGHLPDGRSTLIIVSAVAPLWYLKRRGLI